MNYGEVRLCDYSGTTILREPGAQELNIYGSLLNFSEKLISCKQKAREILEQLNGPFLEEVKQGENQNANISDPLTTGIVKQYAQCVKQLNLNAKELEEYLDKAKTALTQL